MMNNPVFGNELRKSLFRRKPVQCWAVWAAGFAILLWITSNIPPTNSIFFVWFPHIVLPVIAPAFAAGAFAKEREQRTWQDLFLSRLTTREILFGKFFAAYLPVLAVLVSLIPPVVIGYFLSLTSEFNRFGGLYHSYNGAIYPEITGSERNILSNPWPLAGPMLLMGVLQGAFYVTFAMVCSHYCRKARVALGVSYVALALYAIFGYIMISSIDSFGHMPSRLFHQPASSIAAGAGEQLHLLTCTVLTIGAWILLAVGLRFDPEA